MIKDDKYNTRECYEFKLFIRSSELSMQGPKMDGYLHCCVKVCAFDIEQKIVSKESKFRNQNIKNSLSSFR